MFFSCQSLLSIPSSSLYLLGLQYRRLVKKRRGTDWTDCVVWDITSNGKQGEEHRNYRRMAIKTQVQKVCREEGVGFIDMWEEMTFSFHDGLHLTGKGAAVLECKFVRVVGEGTGTINYLN